ncbi:MAG: glycosyltransferase family 4 protein [Paludibacteraceae bacterium]|nr:glycosyltransferase family 4 protein [Paludibacteraceae bacterium]
MKRILLITEHLGSGGAERQICGLTIMLTKAGYPCRLITYIKDQFYEPLLRQNGADYEFLPELQNKKTRVWRMAKYVRKYNPDVVISYLPSVNKAMCLAKLFFKAKLVVSERNNNTCITTGDKIQFNLYRMADSIVPNSHSQGKFISTNFPFLSEKVCPIINFVNVNRFTPASEPVENETMRIVTVARYTEQKNMLVYLKAVRKVKDLGLNVHFDWYGDKNDNPSYYAEVEKEYQRLELADYLTLHEANQKIEEEYRKADAFCLPSLYEGYPNVVAEAMACELPVICSNVYENPYIVEDGVSGFLFDPENVDDIVSAVQKLVSATKEERRKMGVLNRQLCLERNTEEKFIKSYIKLIESL